MKSCLLKRAAVLVLLCALLFSLTGCNRLDYRKAIRLYNAQSYTEAAEIFDTLGDYEGSAALYIRCQYWTAVQLAEQGDFAAALPLFQAAGDYENAGDWVAECEYRLAVAVFESGDLSQAERMLLEAPDYGQTREILRRIHWQRLFDAVTETGMESDGYFTLQGAYGDWVCTVAADTTQPNRLIFSVSRTEDLGYRFYDDLCLLLTRDETQAEFTGSSTFSMDFREDQIGSRQTASGKVDIPTCTAETVLIPEVFEKTVTDNQGVTISSADPADSRMAVTLAENLAALLEAVPELLRASGISQTLTDIGFPAMQ